MPPIRSSASEHRAHTVAVILLLGEIMPSCSCCEEKKLVYITIMAFSSHQPFFYSKCTKANTHSLYDVRLVSTNKYTF